MQHTARSSRQKHKERQRNNGHSNWKNQIVTVCSDILYVENPNQPKEKKVIAFFFKVFF